MKASARSADGIVTPGCPLPLPYRDIHAFAPGPWRDIQCCAVLLILTAAMLLPGSLTLPMELWDESRNANNALAIAIHGLWMVPLYDELPDHWNTKPPLLIWIVAVLLRTGLDPMLAVRLPSIAATMGTVVLVYLACRVAIGDRLAGVLGGLLVLNSVLFMGDHVGRTGDFDALLSFLCLGSVLCVGRYIDRPVDQAGAWIGAGGVLLFLAIMTKGVAAGMALPGLLAYAIARRRFLAILRDWHFWAAMIGVIAGVSAWLAAREQLDPGYLAAMWHNDVRGRLLLALDDHSAEPWSYLSVLARSFQPAVFLSPTLLWLLRDRDMARRRLCLLMLLTATSWLIALSFAVTKLDWYVAPAVPLLAVAIAASTTACLRHATRLPAGLIVIPPVGAALLLTFWGLNVLAPNANSFYAADQVWYGAFLNEIRRGTELDGAVIVDLGLPNDSGFRYYNPVARFFAEDAGRRGEHVRIATPGEPIAKDTTIISCDPRVRDWLNSLSVFTTIHDNPRCVLGHVSAPIKPLNPAE